MPTGKMAQVFYSNRAVETPNETISKKPLSPEQQDEVDRLFVKTTNTIQEIPQK